MRTAGNILLASISLAGLLVVLYLFAIGHFRQEPQPAVVTLIRALGGGRLAPVIEYKDFVSILLTALGVILAALAVILAVAAVWGFKAIEQTAMTMAATRAAEVAEKTATEVAASVAASVATRTARDVGPSDTDAEEAQEIAEAMDGSDDHAR